MYASRTICVESVQLTFERRSTIEGKQIVSENSVRKHWGNEPFNCEYLGHKTQDSSKIAKKLKECQDGTFFLERFEIKTLILSSFQKQNPFLLIFHIFLPHLFDQFALKRTLSKSINWKLNLDHPFPIAHFFPCSSAYFGFSFQQQQSDPSNHKSPNTSAQQTSGFAPSFLPYPTTPNPPLFSFFYLPDSSIVFPKKEDGASPPQIKQNKDDPTWNAFSFIKIQSEGRAMFQALS